MIISLTGENSFALRQRLKELVDKFVAKHGELALEKFDGEETEGEKIIEAIAALPFLSTRKMVVVRNGGTNKQFADQIEQTVSSIPDSTDVILYEPQLDKRTGYFKVLSRQTKLEQFNNLDRASLAKWLVTEVKAHNAKLSFADANYMVERLGQNQQLLYSELTKLAIYSADISRSNIDLLTEPTPQSKVFDLLDAAFSGRKARAIELYDDQRAQKVEPQVILSMIGWQLQLLALIKLAESRSAEKIAKDSGVNPYPLKKAAALANKLSNEQLREMVNEALQLDVKSKTTSLDLDEALKTYITTL
jgi:DNA polymerase-3 subunit delta